MRTRNLHVSHMFVYLHPSITNICIKLPKFNHLNLRYISTVIPLTLLLAQMFLGQFSPTSRKWRWRHGNMENRNHPICSFYEHAWKTHLTKCQWPWILYLIFVYQHQKQIQLLNFINPVKKFQHNNNKSCRRILNIATYLAVGQNQLSFLLSSTHSINRKLPEVVKQSMIIILWFGRYPVHLLFMFLCNCNFARIFVKS